MKPSRKIATQLDEIELTIKEIRAELFDLDQPVVVKRFSSDQIMKSVADLLIAEDELEKERFGQGERGARSKRQQALARLRDLSVVTS